MVRLLSATSSEILAFSASELKQAIKASEGRTILSENVASRANWTGDEITNSEIAAAFGADLILLNGIDVFQTDIVGLPITQNPIGELRRLVGRPVGVNLEPVDMNMEMLESRQNLVEGRRASSKTFQKIEKLGFDFVCLTGNPGTGISNKQIVEAIALAKQFFSGMIIAGKMHSSGSTEKIINLTTARDFIKAGADILLVPAVGTVPGFSESELSILVQEVHSQGGLVMSAIGTSQEGGDSALIREIALKNKMCGVDIHHIGDAGYSGLAPVENIYTLSDTIRGRRHTITRMARSILR